MDTTPSKTCASSEFASKLGMSETRLPRLQLCSMRPFEHNPCQRNDHEAQQAAFRPHRSAAKPFRTAYRCTRKVPGRNHPAIWHRVEKCFAPIPRGVKPNRKPQIPGTTER